LRSTRVPLQNPSFSTVLTGVFWGREKQKNEPTYLGFSVETSCQSR
jgi:hypothetical protein